MIIQEEGMWSYGLFGLIFHVVFWEDTFCIHLSFVLIALPFTFLTFLSLLTAYTFSYRFQLFSEISAKPVITNADAKPSSFHNSIPHFIIFAMCLLIR